MGPKLHWIIECGNFHYESGADVLLPVGSITKMITCAATLLLVLRERLSLDYLAFGKFKVRDLLLHQAGIIDFEDDRWDPLDIPPRERVFRYSNIGYFFLSKIIDHITGDYMKFISDEFNVQISKPTGKLYHDDRCILWDPHCGMYGAGDLVMSCRQIVCLIRTLYTKLGDIWDEYLTYLETDEILGHGHKGAVPGTTSCVFFSTETIVVVMWNHTALDITPDLHKPVNYARELYNSAVIGSDHAKLRDPLKKAV
jgi:hypothetical protein